MMKNPLVLILLGFVAYIVYKGQLMNYIGLATSSSNIKTGPAPGGSTDIFGTPFATPPGSPPGSTVNPYGNLFGTPPVYGQQNSAQQPGASSSAGML